MNERPEPPPEGRLITAALKRAVPKLSAREAARRAGMSEGRWRQIAQGYQTVSAGHTIPVTGPAETLARMALVVGLQPEDLASAGREDVALEMRNLARDGPSESGSREPRSWAELTEMMNDDPELEDAVLEVVRTMIRMRRGVATEERDQNAG